VVQSGSGTKQSQAVTVAQQGVAPTGVVQAGVAQRNGGITIPTLKKTAKKTLSLDFPL